MDLSLAKCTIEKLDLLLEISKATFRDAFEHLNDPEDFQAYLEQAFDREKIENELKNNEIFYYLVYNRRTPVGYFKLNAAAAQTDISDPDSLEIERIYVCKEYQGLKIGNWMITQILNLARRKEIYYLWLGVWEENKDAIRFYQKLGFRKFKEHPYYIGKDEQTDWLMRFDIPKL
ncbi:MAG: N-acetyltransferase [Flavobacteriaceae bacterium]